jgi:uncharacterized protein YutE (UPF0331/DUF86 family)
VSPLDVDIVRRKLAVIARNLRDLAIIEPLSLDEYRADRFRLKGSERLLQELIEAAVDANLHLLRAAGEPSPTDYFQTFVALGRLGVIPGPLAERLAPSAGLRNRLVHEYEAIDDSIVLASIGEARRDFAAYVAAVEQYVSGST